ncbi:MAG: hypothetical protein ABSG75_12645 [Syntrophales bacterium]
MQLAAGRAQEGEAIMVNEDSMTLLTDYGGQDISDWCASEKFHGCRAYWDGKDLWTRGGNIIKAPAWFKEGLPLQHLDGEMFAGYGRFQEARIATQYGKFTEHIRYVVFDAPQIAGDWESRVAAAAMLISGAPRAEIIRHWRMQDVMVSLSEIKLRGGEGLVVRHPMVAHYETGRSRNVVRIKSWPYLPGAERAATSILSGRE